MSRILNYPKTTSIKSTDLLYVDGDDGSRSIEPYDLYLNMFDSYLRKRRLYRGENLGSSFTSDQAEAIESGTFDDLYVGDYWTINGNKWVIADFNYFKDLGPNEDNTNQFARYKNHIIVFLDKSQGQLSAPMNSTANTEGGFLQSSLYLSGLDPVREQAIAAFGDYIAKVDILTETDVENGQVKGLDFHTYENVFLAPTEAIFGQSFSDYSNLIMSGSGGITMWYDKFAFFTLNPTWRATRRSSFWFPQIYNDQRYFCNNGTGYLYVAPANYGNRGIVPFLAVKGTTTN